MQVRDLPLWRVGAGPKEHGGWSQPGWSSLLQAQKYFPPLTSFSKAASPHSPVLPQETPLSRGDFQGTGKTLENLFGTC